MTDLAGFLGVSKNRLRHVDFSYSPIVKRPIKRILLIMTNSKATYEIVCGTRSNPGAVLKSFSGAYKCGGPATACLRAWGKMRNSGVQCFFRRSH